MSRERFVAACVLSLLLCCMILTFVQEVWAQGGDDDGLAATKRQGMSGVFQKQAVGVDDPRRPKPWQKWMGLGSIAVMIIVVKYL